MRVSSQLRWWVSTSVAAALSGTALALLLGRPGWLDHADKLASVGGFLIAGVTVFAAGTIRRRTPAPAAVPEPHHTVVPGNRRLWNIPPPVQTFTGRDYLLAALGDATGRTVLCGPPGVGKSQLALAWAHSRADACQIGWWVRAEDAVTANADLAGLAAALGVGDPDVGLAARNAVAELSRREGWMLVLDDAIGPGAVAELLPHRGGRVLVTSRNPSWDAIARTVEVTPFTVEVGATFLCDRARDDDQGAGRALAKALGGLPLALEQAAAYCRQTGRTLAGYLSLYHAQGGARLLEHGAPDIYPRGPVAVTVNLALRLAARRDPAAPKLLSLFAFFAPTEIPLTLPALAPEALPRSLRRIARDPVRLDNAVRVLIETALVANDRPGHLRVHQLVQDIVRRPPTGRWRRRRGRRWATAATRLLISALGNGSADPANLSRVTVFTPHAQALIQHLDGRSTDSARLQSSISSLAAKMRDAGAVDEARQLVEQVLLVRQQVLGPDHPDTLASYADLAATLSAAGEHGRAVELLEGRVETCRRVFGDQHPETLAAMSDLAGILRRAGRLASAQRLVEQTIQSRRQVLGGDHPQTKAAESQLSEVLADVDGVNGAVHDLVRRIQTLSRRALTVLDDEVVGEEDPERLARLYRLNSLVTRIQHQADGIRVFTGAHPPGSASLDLTDVLRAAVSRIEDYQRVELVAVVRDAAVHGWLAPDLVHLLAEILDNGTTFSPPNTTVRVAAWRGYDARVVIQIDDAGLGMSPEMMAEANARLRDPGPPERFASRLGLAQVARLAARHGIGVELFTSPERGIRAVVTLP